jgi:uncharacterized protein YdbL (DUF1318 family)
MNMRLFTPLAIILLVCIFSLNVYAAQYDLKEITPAVQTALENRRSRFSELEDLKQKGLLGENNKGYVEALKSGDNAQAIAAAENKDRKTIYKAIAEQNNLSHAFDVIESVFAKVQRDKAQSGVMVQNPDGTWVEK